MKEHDTPDDPLLAELVRQLEVEQAPVPACAALHVGHRDLDAVLAALFQALQLVMDRRATRLVVPWVPATDRHDPTVPTASDRSGELGTAARDASVASTVPAEDDPVTRWKALPRRLYLDTGTLQTLYDYGETGLCQVSWTRSL